VINSHRYLAEIGLQAFLDSPGSYAPIRFVGIDAGKTKPNRRTHRQYKGLELEGCLKGYDFGGMTHLAVRDGEVICSKSNDHIVDAVRCAILVREEGNLDSIGEETVPLKPVLTDPVFV